MHAEEPVLLVDLERSLPDVDSYDNVPAEYERYGRCAILRNGAFWYGEVNSSHPPSTQEGFYWAVAGNVLYISPRGARYLFQDYVNDESGFLPGFCPRPFDLAAQRGYTEQ